MYVIVGLGNPGKKYAQTRHNLGFLTIDKISEDLGITVNRLKHKALIGEGKINNQKFMLVKPQTYMNLSGDAVAEIINYYKVKTRDLLVVYDDLDIPIGSLRIRKEGSSGTHNGMRSIIKSIGTELFPRVRIGIGPLPGEKIKMALEDYVIGGFTKAEVPILEKSVTNAWKAAVAFMEDGIDRAMNDFNGNY